MFNTIKSKILTQRSFNLREANLVFADPRSGSTWLVEIIAKKLGYFVVDEPLHLGNDDRLRSLNYGWRQYLPEKCDHPQSFSFFSDLFQGKRLNAIGLHKNSFWKALTCDLLIFKIIRGKMLLPYLLNNFDFAKKPIFLIRHPLAVLKSMKEHSAWNFSFTPFQVPDVLFNEPYIEHRLFLIGLKSQEEIMLSLWCLSNRIFFIDNEYLSKIQVVYYEDLLTKPIETLSELTIFKNVELAKEDVLFKSETVGVSFKENENHQVVKWKYYFSQQELNSYQKIFDYFGISIYDSHSVHCQL